MSGATGLIAANSPEFAHFSDYAVHWHQAFLAKTGNPVRIERVAELYRDSLRRWGQKDWGQADAWEAIMSQDFYSLEDAAKKLGLTTQELNAMAQHREIRAFADRGTWRFKSSDIDELASRRGFVSNPNFRLSDPDVKSDIKGTPSDIFAEDRAKIQAELKGKPSKGGDTGRVDLAALAGDDDSGATSSSSFVFGNKPVKGASDIAGPGTHVNPDDESVVQLGREPASGVGDSRVRLDSPSGRLPDMGVHLVDFDMKPISDPPSSRKLVPPPIPPSTGSGRISTSGTGSGRALGKGDSGRIKPPAKPGISTSSEFELKPAAVGPNDSIFDFTTPSMDNIELELAPGQHDLVDLGGSTQPPAQGGSMRAKLPALDDESSTFELNLEPTSSEELAVMPLTPRPDGIKDTSSEFDLSLQVPEQSSSDFELTVDDSSGAMSALDSSADSSSGSRTARIPSEEVVVGEDSDFELALDDDAAIVDETGSEVVVIDEDDAGTDVLTGGAAVAAGAGLLASRKKKGATTDEEAVVEPYDDEDDGATAAPARAAEWGWVSLVHLPTALIMIFTGFLLFEMVRSISGYETKSVITGKIFDLVKSITN